MEHSDFCEAEVCLIDSSQVTWNHKVFLWLNASCDFSWFTTFQHVQNQNCHDSQTKLLTIPYPDESIIANVDNIISVFASNSENKYPSNDELLKILDYLKSVKVKLEKFKLDETTTKLTSSNSDEVSSIESSNSELDATPEIKSKPGSDEVLMKNDIVRSSVEMLKNGGKFAKLVENKNFSKKSNGNNSSERDSKDSAWNSPLPTQSSLLNSMTVSPCPLIRHKSTTNNKRITRKISRQILLKKTRKKVEKKPLATETQSPNIISTHYATCRIHHYEDKSLTFEIINPNRVNCFGDANEKSEIVIVVLPNGQTALFTTKSSKSFQDILSFSDSQ